MHEINDRLEKANKALHTLSESKLERYEQAVIKHILKHLGVKASVPETPGPFYLKDEIPEWGLSGPEVHAIRLEHNWADFFKSTGHPLERKFASIDTTAEENAAIMVFQWAPEKFMVLGRFQVGFSYLVTEEGYTITTLNNWLDTFYNKDA